MACGRLPIYNVHPLPNICLDSFFFRLSLERRDCRLKVNECSSYRHLSSFRVPAGAGALQNCVSDSFCFSTEDGIDSFSNQASNVEPQMVGPSGCDPAADTPPKTDHRKRRKQEHGNKGKVPWNKGITHTAETRVKIKQKTIEALSDPKVRQKMAANPRPHRYHCIVCYMPIRSILSQQHNWDSETKFSGSDQSKAKIQSSLRQIWAERLKLKRSRERVYHSWLESIANYAKKGGYGEKELDWHSYDKIKQEIAAKLLRRAAKKEKAKEIFKQRRERAAQVRAEKMARIAQRRKEREEQEKRKAAEKRKERRNLKKDEDKSEGINGLQLKRMLTKIRKRKVISGQMTVRADALISHIAADDKLDIEFVRKERMRREVSFADQIQAARIRSLESTCMNILSASETQPSKKNA
ncbi:hypothetical protein ACFE04_007122 [Oxalis oulophora]